MVAINSHNNFKSMFCFVSGLLDMLSDFLSLGAKAGVRNILRKSDQLSVREQSNQTLVLIQIQLDLLRSISGA